MKSLEIRPKKRSIIRLCTIIVTLLFFRALSFGAGPFKVDVQDGRVDLIAEDRTFGEVLNAMVQTGRPSVKLTPEISSRRISIHIMDMEMDRAIARLFTLVQEKNYTVDYGPLGKVSGIKVVRPKTGGAGEIGVSGAEDRNREVRPQQQRRNSANSRRFRPARATRRYRPNYRAPRYTPQYMPGDEDEDDDEEPPQSTGPVPYDDGSDD